MSNEFTLKVRMDNAAFANGNNVEEVRRILESVSEKLDSGFLRGYVFDTNGNKVGTFIMDYEEEDEADVYEEEE